MRQSTHSPPAAIRRARSRTNAGPDTSCFPSRKIHKSVSAALCAVRFSAVLVAEALGTVSSSSEICMKLAVNRESSTFISHQAHGPTFVQLVLTLNNFVLRLRNIGREAEDKILGNAFLKSNSRRWIGIVAANQRIDLQSGDAGQLARAAAHCAFHLAKAGGQHRTGSKTRRRAFLRGLSASDQVNDVHWRQRRIGNIAGLQL